MDLKLNDSILKWASNASEPPESICAYPCKIRQFKIQLELKCCWECRQVNVDKKTLYIIEMINSSEIDFKNVH